MKKIKTLLIGLDAAEWAIINPLIEAGMMPAFKKIRDQGVTGKIQTLNPPFSPMLWTSIATGKTAEKHGILGFVEPDNDGSGIRPVSSTSRKCHAIWNILQSQGYKCNVAGWWPSHPAEPISGVMISNQFQKASAPFGESWPVKEDSVHGVETDKVEGLRVHPAQIPTDMIKIFVPKAESVDQEKDHSLMMLKAMIAETLTIKNTALWMIENTVWDFTAVYFNELDQLSHRFMPFHPPKLKWVPEEYFNIYYNVITATYTFYDTILLDLMEKAGEDTNIILLSDHGFRTGDFRIKDHPKISASIALDHMEYGVLGMYGPAFKNKEEILHASLLDIAPTVLSLYDLPVGKDMDGKVLTEVFKKSSLVNYIESWENESGNFGEHDAEKKRNTFNETEALQQLIDLGYIEKMDESLEEQLIQVNNDTKYNLAVVLANKGKLEAAIDILEKLYEEDVVDIRYNLDLIKYHTDSGNTERAKTILTNFKKFDISHLPNFDYLEGKILLAERKKEEALLAFKKALVTSPNYKELLIDLGYLYNRLNRVKEAAEIFKKIISLFPSCVEAHHGLAIGCNRTGNHDEAVDHALETIKLKKDFAAGHYQLGEAFYRLEEYEVAAQALELCVTLNPHISRARNLLINIYNKFLPNPENLIKHQEIFQRTRKGEIVLVSGLPRSGTSMMMQMIHAGGMEVLVDDSMLADESNPKGYLEYAPVKNSRKDSGWIKDAAGKAVKVIAQLVPLLKMEHKLKIIFMERDLQEVIISQNKMIASKNKSSNKSIDFDMRLMNTYASQLKEIKEWIEKRNHIEVIYIHYKDVIEHPEEEIRKINEFLNWQLDEEKMKAVITPELYRIRN